MEIRAWYCQGTRSATYDDICADDDDEDNADGEDSDDNLGDESGRELGGGIMDDNAADDDDSEGDSNPEIENGYQEVVVSLSVPVPIILTVTGKSGRVTSLRRRHVVTRSRQREEDIVAPVTTFIDLKLLWTR